MISSTLRRAARMDCRMERGRVGGATVGGKTLVVSSTFERLNCEFRPSKSPGSSILCRQRKQHLCLSDIEYENIDGAIRRNWCRQNASDGLNSPRYGRGSSA